MVKSTVEYRFQIESNLFITKVSTPRTLLRKYNFFIFFEGVGNFFGTDFAKFDIKYKNVQNCFE